MNLRTHEPTIFSMAKKRKPTSVEKGRVDKSIVQNYTGSIFSHPKILPQEFVKHVQELESVTGSEVWMMIHQGKRSLGGKYSRIGYELFDSFVDAKSLLPDKQDKGTSLSLLVESPGGLAEPAYRLARLFNRCCGSFDVVVPRMAKSAATLLALGANKIYLGDDAELGPLDAQFFDYDVEEDYVSALDEVQAVEALEQSAIDSAWGMLVYLRERTGKKINTLLPEALHFAAEVTKPLFDKIDAVRYSRQSRALQEAQDYAERLLLPHPMFDKSKAKAIARDLVRNYPTHGFMIDREEAERIGKLENGLRVGLQVSSIPAEMANLLDWFYGNVDDIVVIGKLVEE